MPSYPSRTKTHFTDELAMWVLGSLVVLMPLSFGAYQRWAMLVLLLAGAVLGSCLMVRWVRRRRTGGLEWSVAYLPIAGFLLLAGVQLLPFPTSLHTLLSPQSAKLYQQAADGAPGPFPMTVYPHASWQGLQIIVFASLVFLATLSMVRRSWQIKRLLQIIGITGAALAALAIAQDLFGNGRFYWIGPPIVQANSGTFANHNHFSQHMNLSIMAMLAWAMVRLHETLGSNWLRRGFFAGWMGVADLRLARWFLAFAVTGLLAVALSTSRMGLGSAVAGMLTLGMLMYFRRRQSHSAMPVAVGLVALFVVVFIAGERVYERMSTLSSLESYEDRWTIITDILPAIGQYPLFGTGLGTFSVIYPSYATQLGRFFVSHAENEYIQTLCEMGVLGMLMVVAFVFVLGRCAARVVFRNDEAIYLAAPPLAAGLVTAAIHSWTDFGQHIPAVAGLSAVFCGLLVVLAQRTRHEDAPSGDGGQWSRLAKALPPVLVGVLLVLALVRIPWLLREVVAEAYDQDATTLASLVRPGPSAARDCARVVELATLARDLDPDNAWYWYRLGVARWQLATEGRGMPEIPDQVPQAVQDAVTQVTADLAQASLYCPPMGAPYSFRGQLEWWVLGDERGKDRIEQGIQAAGNNALVWMVGARVAAELGRDEVARERALRAVQLSRGYFAQAVDLVAGYMQQPEAALALTEGDPERLYQLAGILERRGAPEPAKLARSQALAAYADRTDDPRTPAWAFAMLAEEATRQDDPARAAALYRMALGKRYMHLPWRLALARSLILAGDGSHAMLELDTAQRNGADLKTVDELRRLAYAAAKPATQPTSMPVTDLPGAL